jgi:polyisoprenoid-binding protein YceI
MKRLFLAFALCLFPLVASADSANYNASEGNVSSVLIFEQGDFARVYGLFEKGVGRIAFDDQTKVMDNLKLAFLLDSFRSSSKILTGDVFGATSARRGADREVAFVQNEPLRFDGNNKALLKGDLVINGIRKPIIFEATLNKYGRINQTTDVSEDGPMTIGLSMHTSFKRSDYGLSMNKDGGQFQDTVLMMFDIVATR